MGSDGTKALKRIKDAGGYIIAQDESTSVVFGMPKAAAETGLVDQVVVARLVPVKVQQCVRKKLLLE